MDAEKGAERVREIYLLRIKKRASLAEASRKMGEKAPYLTDQLRHSRGIRVRDLLSSLKSLGCCLPQEAYHEALCSFDDDPAGMLEFAREFQKLPMDPFLRELMPRLGALARVAVKAQEGWPSRRRELAQLDLLRRRDRRLAKAELEDLLLGMVAELEQSDTKPSQGFGELAKALGVLAAIYRLAGRRDDAVDVLLPACRLAWCTQDPRSKAEWFQKSAYLLVDLGRNTRAYHFLLEAHRLFDIAGAESDRLRTIVDSAYVLTNAGMHAQARETLEAVLLRLPDTDVSNRLAAHQLLAENLHILQEPKAAHVHLDCAFQLAGDELLAKGYCLWRRAQLHIGSGEVVAALDAFHDALPCFAKLAGAGELAELSMEYASLLLQEKRRPELRTLAADLAGWIDQLKGNVKLRRAIADFYSLIELDELNAGTLEHISREIRRSMPTDRRYSQSVDPSNGS